MFYLLILLFLGRYSRHAFHLNDLCIPSASFSMSEFCYIITVRDYDYIVDVLSKPQMYVKMPLHRFVN